MRKGKILLFTIIALGSGWLGRLMDGAAGFEAGSGPGMLVWILLPALTALGLRLTGDGWLDSGLRFRFRGNGRIYLASLLFYPALAIVVAAAAIVFGGFGFSFSRVTGYWRDAGMVLLAGQIWTNFFEEFAFRGYLAPNSGKAFGKVSSHLVTGLVWGAWHIPYLDVISPLSGLENAVHVPLLLMAAVAASVIYGEWRRRSGSFWPAVVMQFSGGLALTSILSGFTGSGPGWFLIPAFEGGLTVVLTAAVGLVLLKSRHRE